MSATVTSHMSASGTTLGDTLQLIINITDNPMVSNIFHLPLSLNMTFDFDWTGDVPS